MKKTGFREYGLIALKEKHLPPDTERNLAELILKAESPEKMWALFNRLPEDDDEREKALDWAQDVLSPGDPTYREHATDAEVALAKTALRQLAAPRKWGNKRVTKDRAEELTARYLDDMVHQYFEPERGGVGKETVGEWLLDRLAIASDPVLEYLRYRTEFPGTFPPTKGT